MKDFYKIASSLAGGVATFFIAGKDWSAAPDWEKAASLALWAVLFAIFSVGENR